jgi:hypothetical protein
MFFLAKKNVSVSKVGQTDQQFKKGWKNRVTSEALYPKRDCSSCFSFSLLAAAVPLACVWGLWRHGRRNYKDTIPKCRLRCFCLGWCSNFLGYESGQKQSIKLLQNMVCNTKLNNPPTPPTAAYCLNILCTYFGKGGGAGEVRENVEGQQFARGVENTNMTDYISIL